MPFPLITRMPPNPLGRDFVVGDIHGCFSKLEKQLEGIGFNGEKDRLFQLGDLIDRGPESLQVLDWLKKSWFFPIKGNHEDLAFLYFTRSIPADLYRRNGGGWFIDLPEAKKVEVVTALARLPIVRQIGDIGLVHASVIRPTWDDFLSRVDNWADPRTIEIALWGRDRIANQTSFPPVEGIKTIIVGHNVVKFPTWVQNVLHIDTGGWWNNGTYPRPFSILNLSTLKEERPSQ